jgi:predicted kinase
LIPALRAAGLPAAGVTSLDVIRKKLYGRPDILGGSEIEREVRRLEEARMTAGRSVVRDSTGLNPKVRKAEVRRAHRNGVRAVALLSSSLSLTELRRRNRHRDHPVPDGVLEMFHERHAAVTVDELRSEGFDQVVVWNDHTMFTLT